MATRRTPAAKGGESVQTVMARLEERLESIGARLEQKSATDNSDREQMSKDIRDLRDSMAKYKGFWGAILLAASAVATALSLLIQALIYKAGR